MERHKQIMAHASFWLTEATSIECRHNIGDDGREYPELIIGYFLDEKAYLTIYPTMERLRWLHGLVGAYLAAHAKPNPLEAMANDALQRATNIRCPACRSPNWVEHGESFKCRDCGHIYDVEGLVAGLCEPAEPARDGLDDMIDFATASAEATPSCASTRVDADDLLQSMASSFDVRRRPWEDPTPAQVEAATRNRPESVP